MIIPSKNSVWLFSYVKAFFLIGLLSFSLHLHSQVFLGGLISEDLTLQAVNNPHIVVQDLVVPSGLTLTIEPGVIMLFQPSTGLDIYGVLKAAGLPDQRIWLKADIPVAYPGLWSGVQLSRAKTYYSGNNSYAEGSVLSNVNISSAIQAVTLQDSSSVLIENCCLDTCSFGVYLQGSFGSKISGCKMRGNNFGVYIAGGSLAQDNRVEGNTIKGSKYIGVFYNYNNGSSSNNTISKNTILGNTTGIQLGNHGPREWYAGSIEGNTISANKTGILIFQDSARLSKNSIVDNIDGLILRNARYNQIKENLFIGNTGRACAFTYESSNNRVTYNNFSNNFKALVVTADSGQQARFNDILYNSFLANGGVSLELETGPQGPVQFNNIVGNGHLNSFINRSASLVHAEYNWWGTLSETAIDSIIYDLYDNSGSGIVLYKPYLENEGSISPISDPQPAIKQQKGSNVYLTWNPVGVSDLAGYKIYTKTPGLATFSFLANVGNVTTTVLYNTPINDTIAITAYDNLADGVNDQVEGHESTYAIAVLYPYAGGDTSICIPSSCRLSQATAFTYENLLWSTSGDGTFNNIRQLDATYYPGNSDYSNGKVTLKLTIQTQSFYRSDEVEVWFRSQPQVYAGNDTTLIIDSCVQLSGVSVYAADKFRWSSLGGGYFSTDTVLLPKYYFSQSEINQGFALLILTGESSCGTTVSEIRINLIQGYSIHGTVKENSVLLAESMLQIFKLNGSTPVSLRAGRSAANGQFSFSSLSAGKYILFALPPPNYSAQVLPSYYYQQKFWENAHSIEVNANVYDVDIDLVKPDYELPYGEGQLRGRCTISLSSGVECGNVIVYLYDREARYILGWSKVQDDGSFGFMHIPFGGYRLVAEKAGYGRNFSEIIYLSGDSPSALNLLLTLDPLSQKLNVVNQSPPGNKTAIKLYPNPFHNCFAIENLPYEGEYEIVITDMQGAVKEKSSIYIRNKKNVYFYTAKNLSPGLLLVRVIFGGNEIEVAKVIVY